MEPRERNRNEKLASLFGPEGILRVLQMTVEHAERQGNRPYGKDAPHSIVVQALFEELSKFTSSERIVGAVVVRALMGTGRKPQGDVVVEVCRAGKLSLKQQIAVALSMLETGDTEWKQEGTRNERCRTMIVRNERSEPVE